jgi:glycosyltransferase involved in cell wall biosynthesis
MSYPTFSIVIPSFNQGDFIERTLLSILKQNYPGKIEIIVSDGGSTDSTVEILKKYDNKITWWSAPDKGFVDAVNKGFSQASGDIYAIQSSDDLYLQNAFNHVHGAFQRYPESSLICGKELLINPDNTVMEGMSLSEDINPRTFFLDNWWIGITQHTTFFKKEYFNIVKGLTFPFNPASEQDLYYRLIQIKPGKYIDEFIGAYQFHVNQMTRVSDKWERALLHLIDHSYQDPLYVDRPDRLNIDEKKAYEDFIRLFFLDSASSEKAETFAEDIKENAKVIPNKTQQIISKYLNYSTSEKSATVLSKVILKVKYHKVLGPVYEKLYKKAFNKRLRVSERLKDEVAYDVLINWWKN